jgi:hypothetical protein
MKLAERCIAARGTLESWLEGQGYGLALRLTLLDLLLDPVGRWNVRPLILALAAAGLLSESLIRNRMFWLLLSALTAWRILDDWPLSDNHAYLLSYWCLAIFLALHSRDPGRTLAKSARLLIGLAFLFAVLWKGVLSDDFVDGRFFRHLLLTDDRFEEVALVLGGMSETALERARALLEKNLHEPATALPSSIETESLRGIARVATWGTLVLEFGVALLFLLPGRIGVGRLRDAALLVFCIGTYAVAPVPGFGWLLLAMGVAQCPLHARTTLCLYLAGFAVVLFHDHYRWLELLNR